MKQIAAFLDKMMAGSTKERFDHGKILSDFVGMVTRLAFLAAIISFAVTHADRVDSGLPGIIVWIAVGLLGLLYFTLSLAVASIVSSVILGRQTRLIAILVEGGLVVFLALIAFMASILPLWPSLPYQ